MLKVNEIFYSIQGESSLAGWPTVFIRLSGCHLRCQYCDTQYAYYEGQFMPQKKIVERVSQYPARYVCVTGGEPLLQTAVYDLMQELCDRGYHVSLETSGAKSVERVDPRVKIILDIKTPASGEVAKNCWENLDRLPVSSEIKFVVCNDKDVDWALQICREYRLPERYCVWFSPSHGQINPRELAEKVLSSSLPIRMQLQLHKVIWPDMERGV